MRRAVAASIVVCAFTASATSATPSSAPSPADAKAAFGRLLRQLYGGIDGFWTCPGAPVQGGIACLGEVRTGRRWHQVSAVAGLRGAQIVFSGLSGQTWTRRWSPYSRHFILRSNEPQVPGLVSVNSPAYDWGWLAGGAQGLKAGQVRRVDALDGNVNGLHRFYFFTCSRQGALITCRNALGDAMRYRPAG